MLRLRSAKGFGRTLDNQIGSEAKSSGGRFGKAFGTAFKVGAAAVVGGALIAGKFLKDSIGEAREAQKVGAQTNAVIKSTGGVANVTAKSIGRLSTAISNKVGIDDEAIQSAGNMLLTFTNVRNEAGKGNKVFDQSVRAATDMSVALGTDAKSAALQLGKALNDPVKGVTKLQRSGVTFTDQQKKQITTLVKSGQTLKAQKIILGEVNKEFGGSAAAQATAGDKFKVAFGNLEESIGTALLPVLDKVLNAGTRLALFLTKNIGPAFASLSGYLAPTVSTVKTFFATLSGGGGGGAATGFLTIIKSIASSIATNFVPLLTQLGALFQTVVLPALLKAGSYLAASFGPILQKVGTIISTQVIPIVASIAKWLLGVWYPAVLKLYFSLFAKLKPALDALFQVIQTSVLPSIQQLLAKFKEWLPTIQKVMLIVLRVIGFLLRLAAVILAKVLPPLIRFAGFLIRTVVGAIILVVGALVKIIGWLIKVGGAIGTAIGWFGRFSKAVDSKIRAALGFIKDLPGKAKDALGNLKDLLVDKGKDIVQGLIDGIKKMGSKLAGFVKDFVKDHVPGPVAHVLGISSPSKVMAEQARWIPLGMVKGIESEAPALDAAMRATARRVQVAAPRLAFDSASATGARGGSGATYQFYTFDLDSAVRDAQRREAFAGGA